jgi:maltose O-acetyltransferase
MSEFEKMIRGELYSYSKIENEKQGIHNKVIVQEINQLSLLETERIIELEKQVFGRTGENIFVHPPFYIDYGTNMYVGENFCANMDCIFLDVAEIHIGNDVMLGPRVSLFTPGHPIDADVRSRGLEFGLPITIGDRVWIGGNTVINPGVTIGDNVIIGSGSVVTKDVPSNVIAAGNPAKVLREITDEDRHYWEDKEKRYYLNEN